MPISIKAPTWKQQLLIFPLWLPRMKLRQSFHQPLLSMEHLQDNFWVLLRSGCSISISVEIKCVFSRTIQRVKFESSLNLEICFLPSVISLRLMRGMLMALAAETATKGTNLPKIGGIRLARAFNPSAVPVSKNEITFYNLCSTHTLLIFYSLAPHHMKRNSEKI